MKYPQYYYYTVPTLDPTAQRSQIRPSGFFWRGYGYKKKWLDILPILTAF